MKKIALAVLLASGLMAADNGVYMGLDTGLTRYSGDHSYNVNFEDYPDYSESDSESFSENDMSFTLKTGYYFNVNNRVYASYQYTDMDGADANIYSIGYDYLVGENALKPFVGVFVGYGNVDVEWMKPSGAVYGIQMGVNYTLNDNVSIETGLRFAKSNMDDSIAENGEMYSSSYSAQETLEIESLINWFVGVNYKF